MAKRRMTAKQRRYFGKRSSARRSVGHAIRSYRRGVSSRGWLPLSTKEMATSFIVGGTAPMISSYVAPYTDGVLAPLGNYKDEARTAIIGALLSKFGGGMLHEYGKETFRLAVMSAGAQTASNLNLGATTGSNTGFVYG